MKKIIFTFLLLFAMAAPNLSAQIHPAFAAAMDQTFDSLCKKYNLKGASAAVAVPGVGVWKGTHGISRPGNPIQEDMVLGIGSNTKTFTAVAMLLLQEQGKLSLDDTIGSWVRHANIDGQITIRQMLNHTSGINSYTNYLYINDSLLSDMERVWQPAELLDFIGKADFAPGSKWNYSNSNYLIAGIIIEKVTGKKYHEAVRELILVPQKLTHTYIFPQETPSETVAYSWSMNFGYPYLSGQEAIGYSHIAFFSMANAAGAIMSTAEDNALFWEKLNGGDILSEASWKEMRKTVRLDFSVDYGLGIFRYRNFHGRTCFSHGGTNIGFINENIVDSTTGISFSILTNQDSISNSVLFNKILYQMLDVSMKVSPSSISATFPAQIECSLYPNPAFIVLNITPSQQLSKHSTFTLTDLSGKIAAAYALDGNTQSFSVSQLPVGMYIATITSANNELVFRQKVSIAR